MNNIYIPGPGDSATWGKCTGHPNDPRSPDPEVDEISEEDAPDLAADLLRSTPAVVSEWLEAECTMDRDPLCYLTLARALRSESRDLSVPELLVLLLCGPAEDMLAARYALVEKFDAAHREQAKQDAEEMLNEQARQRRLDVNWPELWS